MGEEKKWGKSLDLEGPDIFILTVQQSLVTSFALALIMHSVVQVQH